MALMAPYRNDFADFLLGTSKSYGELAIKTMAL